MHRAAGQTSLRESRELFVNLTLREVRSKYKRTALGHLWSLVNPLASMLMYTLVFNYLLKISPSKGDPSGLKIYALFLLAGLLSWTFFQNAVTSAMGTLIDNANLVKKVFFRRDVLVAATVASWLVTFAIEMLVLTVAILAFGGMPLLYLPVVLVVMALLTIFAVGLGLLLSVMNVYFRDTQHFIAIFFQLWFYLTPVIYPLSRVTDKAKQHPVLADIYKINPLEHFTQAMRNLMYDNRMANWQDLAVCVLSAFLALGIGTLVFKRFEGRLAEEL